MCSDICPRPLSVPKSEQFSESVENCEPRGTDNLCEQTYPSIYLHKLEAIAFNILQRFLATCTVLNIGEYNSDIPQSCDTFKPIVHKRNIWWIIKTIIGVGFL